MTEKTITKITAPTDARVTFHKITYYIDKDTDARVVTRNDKEIGRVEAVGADLAGTHRATWKNGKFYTYGWTTAIELIDLLESGYEAQTK